VSDPVERTDTTSARGPRPVGAYPHARRVGNLLFLSGLGPRDPVSNQIPGNVLDEAGRVVAHDIRAQCHAVFRNVLVVLEDAGASWEDIIDVTVFLTHMEEDFRSYNEVYSEYFSVNRPTRTTVEVSRLPTPIAIELKVIAEIRERKTT
jgi:2-aminomuconate deaminase